jgi:hypothetical protein
VRDIPASYLKAVLTDPFASLVAHLVAAAPARQITELTASVLTQNATVAGLLRQIPGEFFLTRHGTTISVRVPLHQSGPSVRPETKRTESTETEAITGRVWAGSVRQGRFTGDGCGVRGKNWRTTTLPQASVWSLITNNCDRN